MQPGYLGLGSQVEQLEGVQRGCLRAHITKHSCQPNDVQLVRVERRKNGHAIVCKVTPIFWGFHQQHSNPPSLSLMSLAITHQCPDLCR